MTIAPWEPHFFQIGYLGLDEHERPSNVTSPVVEHVKGSRHSIDWENVQVLDQDPNWFGRGVREAINIRRHGSTLNKDKGRHVLPPVYDQLLSRDTPVSRDRSGDTTVSL